MTSPPPGGYGSPPYRQQPPVPVAPTRPAVWQWYIAYTFATTLVCILIFLGGLGRRGDAADAQRLEGLAFMVVAAPFAAAHFVAPFLPKTPGAWTYHLVVISVGIAFCWPVAVPLLYFWLKPETKQFFGRG